MKKENVQAVDVFFAAMERESDVDGIFEYCINSMRYNETLFEKFGDVLADKGITTMVKMLENAGY